jgi:glutaredoxin
MLTMCRWAGVRAVGAFLLLCVLTAWPGVHAAARETASSAPRAAGPAVLEVYVREGCPHCADAKVFLAQLARERPGLRIVLHAVDQDAQAREALAAHSRAAGVWPPGVPTFVFDHRVMVGFDDAEHSGRELLALIEHRSAPQGQIDSDLFGTLSASRLGLPVFTLALGLLDGVNPCAMWVLLFLLSLLVRLQDRRRMALIAGTFVLVSGAVYFAFMAAWLNVFLAMGMSEAVRRTLGVAAMAIGGINLKDFVAWGRGPSLSIPDSVKPGLYARMRRVLQAQALPASLLATAALAVVVNFVELLCTAGIPAIYSAVLAGQQLGTAAHYAYLGLYILGYIADDAVMVGLAVWALGSGKLSERSGRRLKLISGSVMLVLGTVLLLRPGWLF